MTLPPLRQRPIDGRTLWAWCLSTCLLAESTAGAFDRAFLTPVIRASKVDGILASGPLAADDLQRAVNTCQLL